MIPSRPLELAGILAESIRIIKLIYWRAALVLLLFAAPGIIVVAFGFDGLIDGAQKIANEYTSVSAETPVLVRDYFLDEMKDNSSLWLYRIQYPEVFTVFDSIRSTIQARYPDSAHAVIESRLDSIEHVVEQRYGAQTEDRILGNFWDGISLLVAGIGLYIIGLSLSWAALFDLASRAFEERSISLAKIFNSGLLRNALLLLIQNMLLILALLVGFSILVAITALISPAFGVFAIFMAFPVIFYFLLRVMFCGIALVSEELPVFAGIKRSFELTKNGFVRVFGITLIGGLLFYIVSILASLPLSFAMTSDSSWVLNVVRDTTKLAEFFAGFQNTLLRLLISGFVSSLITASFFPSFFTTFYYDLRTRREGPLDYGEKQSDEIE